MVPLQGERGKKTAGDSAISFFEIRRTSFILSFVRCLFLNTASHDGFLACTEGHVVRGSIACTPLLRDDQLAESLGSLLRQAGWDYGDLTHVACVTGPGGFTTLRVAVACANVLADQLQIPVAGVHLSDMYQARAPSGDLFWLHSTKRDELFIRGFGRFSELWPQPAHIMLPDFLRSVPGDALWCGELIADHQAVLPAGFHPSSLADVSAVLPGLLSSAEFGAPPILPWYGRGF